ncbi:hypothetical protein CLV63_106255 [Murinocardiopsis flavida]|uniref:Uncharacterized protein n=1 Tax=Murinocardiopsis flavida TaxID=645275 RepID=A0A2P8DLZ1_9ACTN|nr:hypothetical protein CLV63_106255 [Murinocardiopsis flavida]
MVVVAGARRAVESGNDVGGSLALRFPAREDRETRDGIGAGPDSVAAEPPRPSVAAPGAVEVEVDGSVPFWRWELTGLPLPEVDLARAAPGERGGSAG